MDKTRKRRNAYKGNVSCRAWPTIRNTRAHLREWSALDDQFDGKGIEDYLTKNVDWCSEVQVVIPNNMDDPSGSSSHISCWKRAAVATSEYGEIDGSTGAMQDEIFSNKELLACLFHELSSKTINVKRKSAKTRGDIRKSDKFTNQASLNKQINCSKENVVHTDFLQKLPTRVFKPFRERRQNQSQTGNENEDIPTKINKLGVYTTCPTHVYAFRRGLVSSEDAQNLELINSNRRAHPTLPPVFADRVGKTPDVKQYRLTLESDVRMQKNLHISKHYPQGSPETCTGSEKEQSMEPKLVISRIFSAEKVIPVTCSKRRFFDFQGYIDFLYKERKNTRHTNGACNSGEILVEDRYNCKRMLDVKGSQIKLDENPIKLNLRCVKPPTEQNDHDEASNPRNKNVKATQQKKKTGKHTTTAIINRFPPNKFQLIFPGRPPSSDDSGFAE